MAKVSIIIPVYNTEKFLKRCLDSIINQTFKDIEIVCVNDGSKDNSLNILKEYHQKDNRILIINQENSGVSAARNAGVIKSSGEYIMFVDSDDWIELDTVESVYYIIEKSNVDVVKFNCITDNSYKNEELEKGDLCGLEEKEFSTSQNGFVELINTRILSGELYCSVCLLMIRKEALLKTSLFVKGIPYAEDCILFNELLDKIETIYFTDKCLYHYYRNLSSCTKSSKYYVQNIYSSARAYEKLIEIIENDKFEKKNRVEATNDRFGRIIMGSLFLIYLDKQKTKKEFIQLLDELMSDKTIPVIIRNTDIRKMAVHLSIPFKLLNKRKFKTLVMFYDFRNICRNIKEKLYVEEKK